MLFNLLLQSTRILLCLFFLFLVICNNFFIIHVVKENTIVKLTLAIPAGAPITLAKEIIDTPPFVADKTIKALPKQSKAAMYLLSSLLIIFLSLISQLK